MTRMDEPVMELSALVMGVGPTAAASRFTLTHDPAEPVLEVNVVRCDGDGNAAAERRSVLLDPRRMSGAQMRSLFIGLFAFAVGAPALVPDAPFFADPATTTIVVDAGVIADRPAIRFDGPVRE
jgi:hypothetical protein